MEGSAARHLAARRWAVRGLRWLRDLVLALLVLLALAAAAGAALTIRVYGTSMDPTVSDGNLLVIDRLSLRLGWPDHLQRGELVVITQPNGVAAVKRLIGMPGDRIEIRSSSSPNDFDAHPEILIEPDGRGPWRRLVEPYVRIPWTLAERCCSPSGRDVSGPARPFTVPRGTYWVLGDNRNVSLDSRAFGVIPRDRLQGIVLARYWPLNQAGWLGAPPRLAPI